MNRLRAAIRPHTRRLGFGARVVIPVSAGVIVGALAGLLVTPTNINPWCAMAIVGIFAAVGIYLFIGYGDFYRRLYVLVGAGLVELLVGGIIFGAHITVFGAWLFGEGGAIAGVAILIGSFFGDGVTSPPSEAGGEG